MRAWEPLRALDVAHPSALGTAHLWPAHPESLAPAGATSARQLGHTPESLLWPASKVSDTYGGHPQVTAHGTVCLCKLQQSLRYGSPCSSMVGLDAVSMRIRGGDMFADDTPAPASCRVAPAVLSSKHIEVWYPLPEHMCLQLNFTIREQLSNTFHSN